MHPKILATSICIWLGVISFSGEASGRDEICTYNTYQWNVRDKKAVRHLKITKLHSELSAAEKDERTGCSVCEEDQVTLTFHGLRPVKVCKFIAPQVQVIMDTLQSKHAPLIDVIGYRVGMTRGELDSDGNRTGFSNHSFGVALDINTDQNGLYENCASFNSSCHLIKGGKWDSDQEFSLTKESIIVQEFERNGFHWGGDIPGQQKDFMHFSPSGY